MMAGGVNSNFFYGPPSRCLSSQLTTGLALFANPHGAETNWLDLDVSRHLSISLIGKMVLAEVGSALLIVSSTVEVVAFSFFTLCSLPLSLYRRSFQSSEHCLDLLSSSAFTVVWNLGNFFVFNVFYGNVFTHESIARCAADLRSEGRILNWVIVTAKFVCFVALASFGMSISGFFSTDPIKWARSEDRCFFMNWYEQYRLPAAIPPPFQSIHQMMQSRQTPISMTEVGLRAHYNKRMGACLIQDFYLKEGQLETTTQELVREADAGVMHLITARCVYLYVFGEKRGEPLPDFLKSRTRGAIESLRLKYAGLLASGDSIAACFKSHHQFSPVHPPALLNEIKEASFGELRGSFFLTICVPYALQLFEKESEIRPTGL